MRWQVVCAAPALAIPDDDLSIEATELSHAHAELWPSICQSEAEVAQAGPSIDGLTTLHHELTAGRWRRDLLEQIPPIYGQTLGLVGSATSAQRWPAEVRYSAST